MNKSVSILGCGWLGMPLAKHLQKAGYVVKGSSTTAEKLIHLRDEGMESYEIDLSADREINASFFNSDVLIVTVPPRSRSQQPGVYLAQIKKLTRLLTLQTQIEQVIYTSSTSVYPDIRGLAKEESVSLPEQSAHAELVEVENLFLSLPNRTVTIIRLGGLTGGSRLLVRHFAGKKELAGGNYPVNLIHQEDAIGAIRFVLEKKLAGVYNACSPQHPYKKDFYRELAHRFQMPIPEFSEEDVEVGKTIDVGKLEKEGFVFSFAEPSSYSYDQDLN